MSRCDLCGSWEPTERAMPRILFLIIGFFLALNSCVEADLSPQAGNKKIWEVFYTFETADIAAEGVRVWVPYPADDGSQRILDMAIEAPSPVKITYDPEWGNKIIYFEPTGGDFKFSMRLKIERKALMPAPGYKGGAAVDEASFSRYLRPSRFAVHSERVKRFSQKAVEGKKDIIGKARAIYDFVLDNMDYGKDIPGWGRGDVERICLTIAGGGKGAGNCTDFHSFFSSLMQVQGIPVVFEMGFPIESAKEFKTVKGGYHCWAKFFVPGMGWRPVDISEADKDPAKRDYYFGSMAADRVGFSVGRDVVLHPPQKGKRLNFFGPDPYIEVNGKEFDGFTRSISYREL